MLPTIYNLPPKAPLKQAFYQKWVIAFSDIHFALCDRDWLIFIAKWQRDIYTIREIYLIKKV